jgi:HPt (histidine-containing phosphotransfer) domain-containing protein
MTRSLINTKELLARVENDRDLMRDLLSIFKEEFPQHHRALQEAVQNLDAARVAAEAHTLKGMLSNLAIHEAAGAASRLENIGRSGETEKLGAALGTFDKIVEEVLAQLESYMAEVSG